VNGSIFARRILIGRLRSAVIVSFLVLFQYAPAIIALRLLQEAGRASIVGDGDP